MTDNLSSDIASEYRTATTGAGIRLLAERVIVRVSGDDHVSFMHGMCSADIKRMTPGMVLPALFLTEHAHVIGDFLVFAAEDDSLLIEIDREVWPQARAHLERFLVADDVELDELDDLAVIDIEGPRSRAIVPQILEGNIDPLEPWRHVQVNEARVANIPRFGGAASTILMDRERATKILEHLKAAPRADGLRLLSAATLDLLRIEHGIAQVGVDTNERTLALEARLDRAISFDKGCYVGQETVERATARGALKRRLCGLRVQGAHTPAPGAAIVLEHKEVGRLTSVAVSPASGIVGLAILHHSAWAPGTQVSIVDIGGEFSAEVSDLPLIKNGDASARP